MIYPVVRRNWLDFGVPPLLGLIVLTTTVLSLRAVLGANARSNEFPPRLGRWNYTALADGTFAAFIGRKSVAVESRWRGPRSLKLSRAALPFPAPFAMPKGSWWKFAPSGAISPDRNLLATELRGKKAGSWSLCVWRLNQGHPIPVIMAGRAQAPYSGDLDFSPRGRSVVSLGWLKHPWRRVIFVHNAATGAISHCLTLPPGAGDLADDAAVRFVSSGRIVCALNSSVVRLICLNIKSGRLRYENKFPKLQAVDAIASCEGSHLILLGGPVDGPAYWPTIYLLNATTGKLVKSIALKGDTRWGIQNMRGRYISNICISPGAHYAVGTEFGYPRKRASRGACVSRFAIIDLRLAKVVYYSPPISAEAVWHVDVSQHGNRLLFAGQTSLFVVRPPFRL